MAIWTHLCPCELCIIAEFVTLGGPLRLCQSKLDITEVHLVNGSPLTLMRKLLTFLSPGAFGISADHIVTAELVLLGRSSVEAFWNFVGQLFVVLGILVVH